LAARPVGPRGTGGNRADCQIIKGQAKGIGHGAGDQEDIASVSETGLASSRRR
jgi:hypothetical protein